MARTVPLRIPPGVYRNGTQYQAKGRWYDAALVRWRNGAMAPVGGWENWTSTDITGIARGLISWRDNSNARWIVVGTHSLLYVYDDDGARYTITPAGFTTGSVDASYSTGYGDGTYGTGLYGSPRPDIGEVTPCTTWSMDTWGQYWVGCSNDDGKLYEWQLNTGAVAAAITNAPTSCTALVVTAERFLFALGAGGDPRKVQWCDQGTNTTWTAAATNQAGDKILETSGALVCGAKVRGQTLLLTTRDAHVATYIGKPFIYNFEKVGAGCGIVAANALAVVDNNMAVWMGERGFFMYDGYVRRVPCDLIDFLIDDLSEPQRSKIYAFHNSMYDEVWWFYPSDTENECDSYVAWNYVENHWAMGPLARSAAIDRGVFERPIMVGTDQGVYEHETGLSYGTDTPYAESGPFEIGDGERWMHATSLIPDEDTLGDVSVTFKTRPYPTASETSHGPYTASEPTDVRFGGRQAVLRVSGGGADWRWGNPRLDVVPGGKR